MPTSWGTAWVPRAAPWGPQLGWDLQGKVREGQAGPGRFGEAEVCVAETLGCPQSCPFLPNPFIFLSLCIPLPGPGRAAQEHRSLTQST